jgi:hypothetical protein
MLHHMPVYCRSDMGSLAVSVVKGIGKLIVRQVDYFQWDVPIFVNVHRFLIDTVCYRQKKATLIGLTPLVLFDIFKAARDTDSEATARIRQPFQAARSAREKQDDRKRDNRRIQLHHDHHRNGSESE